MNEEIIYVVDEEDKFVRKATRKEVKQNALMHRTVRVIIHDDEEKFLVQKRSIQKDMFPGYWDIGLAGTVINGASYEETAMRELREELGIVGVSNIQLNKSLLFKIKYKSSNHNLQLKVYKLVYDGKLILQKEEVDEVNFLTIEEIKKLIQNSKFHPVGKVVLNKYLEIKNE